jgi:hypothetical protein
MSTIPNSAMPHAGPTEETVEGGETLTMARRAADLAQSARTQAGNLAQTARTQAGKLVDLARENPKTAIAAGAAIAAGTAAAVAIPLVRGKQRRSAANGSSAPKSEGAKAPARKRSTTRRAPAKKS